MPVTRNHAKETVAQFHTASQEAERDKYGVNVSHLDGIDFGIVSLSDAQRGVEIALTMTATVPSPRTQVLETKFASNLTRTNA